MSDSGTSTPIRILYIDDEPALLDLTKLFLEEKGRFIVDILEDSLEAAEIILGQEYDAVISDYQMPSKDGITLLKEIRAAGSTVPFIIFTGKGREDIVIEALNNGADFYLQKGGNPRAQFAELAHQIETAVAARRAKKKIAESLDELNAAYEQLASTEEEIRQHLDEAITAQVMLRKSEERYRNIFENTGSAIAIFGQDLTIVKVNSLFEELSGYTAAEIEGKIKTTAFIHPDDLDRILEYHQARHQNGEASRSYEFRFIRRDGEERIILISIGVLPGERLSIASLVDITEWRRAEEELAIREKILSKIMEILPIGLWFADKEGRLTMGNPAGVAIWGAEPHVGIEEYGVFKARRYPSGEEIAPDDWALAHSIRDQVTITDELLEIDCFDGEKRLIYNYTAPVILDDGTLQGAIVVNRDVTMEKRSEEALKLSNKKIRLLSGITRHDIQNQMMVLFGYIELIQQENPDRPIADYLQEIIHSIEKMEQCLEFMKEYEKIGTAGPTWQGINVSLEPLTDSRIPIRNTCQNLSIIADPLLTKVFSNLLDNTIRHGEDATEISISCEESDGNMQIIWQDNGTGVPDDMKERIFEYKCGRNSGFGLYLVREILAITGITIHEEGIEGVGARFVISVPAGRWKIE